MAAANPPSDPAAPPATATGEAGLMGPASNSSGSGHLLAEAQAAQGSNPPGHPSPNSNNRPETETSQNCVPGGDTAASNDLMTSSVTSIGDDLEDNRSTPKRPARKSSTHRSREHLSALNREREDRVKKVKEMQEEERRRKLEELKQHAQAAAKFREQQEQERRKHLEQQRAKENDKLSAVAERRRALESADRNRKEAMLKKAQEREDMIADKRRERERRMHFAFGSSTPRSLHPAMGSTSDIWGASRSRSTSSTNVNVMSQSMYAPGPSANRKSAERDLTDSGLKKRTSSAHGLDRSGEGDENAMSQSFCMSAHRRRTDLMPTITPGMLARENSASRASTPHRRVTPGMSREGSVYNAGSSRPPSAMSTESSGVRMRTAPNRRSRPISIATTGVMSTSMFEPRLRTKSNQKPTESRMKRSRSIDKDDDAKSSSSLSISSKGRKTPSQVKADSAARKAKSPVKAVSSPAAGNAKKDVVRPSASSTEGAASRSKSRESVDSGKESESREKTPNREVTPDIIAGSPDKQRSPSKEPSEAGSSNGEVPAVMTTSMNSSVSTPKKIISSEEEAKARLAEKRREMKEKREQEAELERQRLADEARLEAERVAKEEEEERQAMEEANRLAQEARKAEEERLQKAIEDAQKREEEERLKKEEEEKAKKEKEEADAKAKLEAEQKQKELEEKLRKEEEERLARKKRIEEIMARTRGNKGATTPTSTPKKETAPSIPASGDEPVNGTTTTEVNSSSEVTSTETVASTTETSLHSNSESASSPMESKPDLIGDIVNNKSHSQSSEVDENNERNSLESPVEKGVMDTQIKEENTNGDSNGANKNGGLNLSEFEGLSLKSNGDAATTGNGNPEFDQILDLNEVATTSNVTSDEVGSPIIAFEASTEAAGSSHITTNPEPPTADLLS